MFASFEMCQMEEATDLSYDISWLNRFMPPDIDGVEQGDAQADHPGTDDEFAAESIDDDSETFELMIPRDSRFRMLGYALNEAAEKIVHSFDGNCTVSWGGPDPVTGKIKVAL
jgi:hypothetical protein